MNLVERSLKIKMEYISEFLIQKAWEIRVSLDFRVLKDVPKEYITQSMCENAVERNYFMLSEVPKEYRTQEMCLKAFEKYASLEYVPCLLYTSPSPRDKRQSRMPSSA